MVGAPHAGAAAAKKVAGALPRETDRAETQSFWVSTARLTALARSTALPLPQ